ncbi:glycosyl transferase [Microbacterium sp. ZW T5_56]|uniref:glycosyl transferase n=1 Tax=Microbacterium sp. ZW T5_56 TaxID=3378081 RepID=UPI003852DBAC
MRFVWAVASFVIAAILIAGGIAQRTVFLGPNTERAELGVSADQAYTMIDGEVFNKLPGVQTLKVDGSGDIFGAIAVKEDVAAWLADSSYNHVTLAKDGTISSTVVAPTEEAPAVDETVQKGIDAATTAGLITPNSASPVGSDLWTDEFTTDTGSMIRKMRLPDAMAVLIATDGQNPAPSDIALSWAIDNSTPWAGPLVVLGGIALIVGILLYVLGIRHMRRSRGPRRRGVPPLPETQPISVGELDAAEKGVISSSAKKRGGRRSLIAIPALVVSGALLSGCTADAWPKFDEPTATPSPTPTVIVPEDQEKPSVTEQQAEKILDRIATTAAAADSSLSIDVASTRLSDAVLSARATNYTLRSTLPDIPALTAVPSKPYQIIVPEAKSGWPRTILAVWQDEADTTVAPRILIATQTDAWSPYKVSYLAQLEASAQTPNLAPAELGANLVRPDSSLLVMAPDQVAGAYADVLDKGATSEFASNFDLDVDTFLPKITTGRQQQLDTFNATAEGQTGTLQFAARAGASAPVALMTVDNGAIVAVNVEETETSKPSVADAVIKLDGNPRVTALTGVTQSQTGFQTTYSDQLFFFVPGQSSGEKIRLLGFSSDILKAEVLP